MTDLGSGLSAGSAVCTIAGALAAATGVAPADGPLVFLPPPPLISFALGLFVDLGVDFGVAFGDSSLFDELDGRLFGLFEDFEELGLLLLGLFSVSSAKESLEGDLDPCLGDFEPPVASFLSCFERGDLELSLADFVVAPGETTSSELSRGDFAAGFSFFVEISGESFPALMGDDFVDCISESTRGDLDDFDFFFGESLVFGESFVVMSDGFNSALTDLARGLPDGVPLLAVSLSDGLMNALTEEARGDFPGLSFLKVADTLFLNISSPLGDLELRRLFLPLLVADLGVAS